MERDLERERGERLGRGRERERGEREVERMSERERKKRENGRKSDDEPNSKSTSSQHHIAVLFQLVSRNR